MSRGTIACMFMRIILASLVVLVSGLTAGCSATTRTTSGSRGDARSVVVAFYPLAWLAEQLGGSSVRVTNLTPAGSEPHELELAPDDLAAIRDADVVLYVGRGFQPAVEAALAGTRAVKVDVLDAPGLDLLSPRAGRAGTDERLDVDPHVWLDPSRFAAVARFVAPRLDADARPVEGTLDRLDATFRSELTGCRRHEFVTTHAAFGYLADAYGLDQVPITGVSPEAEPLPRDLERVVRQARSTHAGTIFFEPLVSSKLARQVAHEANASAAVLDPIEGITPRRLADGVDYIHVQRANARALHDALDCRGH